MAPGKHLFWKAFVLESRVAAADRLRILRTATVFRASAWRTVLLPSALRHAGIGKRLSVAAYRLVYADAHAFLRPTSTSLQCFAPLHSA